MATPFEHFQRVLVSDGWNITIESRLDRQPIRLTITRGDVILPLRVYIWNVTPGGPPGVRPDQERRIQRTSSPLELGDNRLTLLLGWSEEFDVFVAWNAAAHITVGSSPSIQVRTPFLDEAREHGIAIHHREQPPEDVVAVRADHLTFYLEQAPVIHGEQFTGEVITFPELDTRQIEKTPQEEEPRQQRERVPRADRIHESRRASSTRVGWVRSTTFRRAVAWAYSYQCATCGIDLGLVESAHIVPITDARSTEHPSNGLALCGLHHDAYDDGIIGVTDHFEIVLNQNKVAELDGLGLASGIDTFMSITPIGNSIKLPGYEPYRPDPELLRIGLALRGFV